MKILAFAASTSRQSINKKLANYAATLVDNADVELLDLNDFEMPLFSEDKEKEIGQPELAKAFLQKIAESDALIISFAEHNGSYAAAYKNVYDWCSRIEPKVYQGKPAVLLAASPGPRGGAGVLAVAVAAAPYQGIELKSSFSLPSFYDNFDMDKQAISDPTLGAALKAAVSGLTG